MSTNVKRRSIVHELDFESGLERLFGEVRQADRIFADWLEALARSPERGYPVQGAPDYAGLPIHTDQGSYLIIYWFDEDCVYCLGLRRVPGNTFGD